MKHKLLIAACTAALVLAPVHTAHAFFPFGGIVYDPTNHAQNLLTAARTLAQINNQVRQLANEAQMLVGQAQNLSRLPTSIASDLQQSLFTIDTLLTSARRLAYDVAAIDREYQRLFPEKYSVAIKSSVMNQHAQDAWLLAREGLHHSLQIQAEVVTQVRSDSRVLDQLVTASQGAAGNLQALQAGNQLTALAAKQSMQMQTLLAAALRAETLERARVSAAREQGRARFVRFMGDDSAYTRR